MNDSICSTGQTPSLKLVHAQHYHKQFNSYSYMHKYRDVLGSVEAHSGNICSAGEGCCNEYVPSATSNDWPE